MQVSIGTSYPVNIGIYDAELKSQQHLMYGQNDISIARRKDFGMNSTRITV